MSGGAFTITVPHICGHEVGVHVSWSYYPGRAYMRNGDPGYPDEYDENRTYLDTAGKQTTTCPKCGIDLDYDDLFQSSINTQIKETPRLYDDSEYYPGDEFDYEPDDYPWKLRGPLD